MAAPSVLKGQYITLAVESATPGTYTTVCGITTKSFVQQVNQNDQFVRDCADPEDIPVRRVGITGKQADLSGEGLYNRAQRDLLEDALGVTKNWRLIFTEPSGEDVDAGHYQGPFVLTNLQLGGGDGEFGTVSLQLASDGEWAWTPAA